MKFSKIISVLLIAVFLVVVVGPEQADPGMKQFGRWVKKQTRRGGKKIFRGVKFLTEVPGKLEYRMKKAGIPPVVAVFGSGWLMKKALANPKIAKIFRNSGKIVRTKEQIKRLDTYVSSLKQFYRDESQKLFQSATDLFVNQVDLRKKIIPKKWKYAEFKSRYLQMQKLGEAQIELAEKLNKQADRLGRTTFFKLAGKMALEKTFGNIKKIVTTNIAEEILKSTNPDVIIMALEGGATVDSIVTAIVAKDVKKELGLQGKKKDFDAQALAKKITADLRKKLREDKKYYRKNWRTFIKESVKNEVDRKKADAGYLEARFKAEPQKGQKPLSVKFDASLSAGKIKEYKWVFGDNSEGSGKTTTHTYNEEGTFEAELTVTGEKGGVRTSDKQKIRVLPKPSPPSVTLSVKPPEVDPGEKVTINAKVTLGKVKNGTLTVTFNVGKQSLKSEVVEGDLDYGDQIVRVYEIPSDAAGGQREVTSTPTVKLNEADAEKYGKDKFTGSTAKASFTVRGGPEGVEAFVGRWLITERVPVSDGKTEEDTGYTDIIKVDDNRIAMELLNPKDGKRIEYIFTVKGKTAKAIKSEKDGTIRVTNEITLNITARGKLAGTGVVTVTDMEDHSELNKVIARITGSKLGE